MFFSILFLFFFSFAKMEIRIFIILILFIIFLLLLLLQFLQWDIVTIFLLLFSLFTPRATPAAQQN